MPNVSDLSADAVDYYAGGFRRMIGGYPCKVFSRRTKDGRFINAKDSPAYDVRFDHPTKGESRLPSHNPTLCEAAQPVAPPPAPPAPAKPQPVELPKPQPVAAPLAPAVTSFGNVVIAHFGAGKAAPEPVQPLEPVAATPEPQPAEIAPSVAARAVVTDAEEAEPVKIEDVYGRVYFVMASDFDDASRTLLRRVTKQGAPFCDRESQGGQWQRIHRDNIKRRIFPRGSVDAPAKVAAAGPVAPQPAADMAARLEALESIVARLAAGEAVELAPAAPQPDPALVDEIAALRAENERLTVAVEEYQGLLAAAYDDTRHYREAEERANAKYEAQYDKRERATRRAIAARARRRAEVAQLQMALAEEFARRRSAQGLLLSARASRARAVTAAQGFQTQAARLALRCDALESHAAASARFDFARPADAQPSAPILVAASAVPSRPRAA